jgi:preprotein translocase subunit SecD
VFSNRLLIAVIIFVTLLAIIVDIKPDIELKRGLDLAGGARLTFQADMSNLSSSDRDSALESLRGIIERRVNLYGVSEPIIQTSKVGGNYRVIFELAGVTDVSQAIDLVGKTAQLTFREEAVGTDSGSFATLTDLSGRDLKIAKPAFKSDTGEPIIELTFNSDGARKFESLTKKNLGKRLAIFLDDQLLMAPTIQSEISGGQAIITGNFTAAQTKQFAILLNSGALPAPVHLIEQRVVGATLGQESIDKSLVAGIVGLAVVVLFMIGRYGKLGLFADLALVIYALLVMALFKLIPVTLTLAGIAGFILSIGMAVDANILIFERMREEIRWGKTKLAAIELGFSRAFPSIRDSNASSLITCVILYWFGTGSVRGFAVTLAIGILVSLFTAITATRTFLRLAERYV